MTLLDILHLALDAQVCAPPPTVSISCGASGMNCPGSAMTSIGAAYATVGYFVQSDMIHYLMYGDIQMWAPLLYIVAAISGMIGVAIGTPPRTYMWFFLGPGIFHWLLATPETVSQTEWRIGNIPMDQRMVWRDAEVSLVNLNVVRGDRDRAGYQVSSDSPPTGGPNGDGTVDVAMFFARYDALVSDTVQWFIQWTGAWSANDNYNSSGNSNLSYLPGRAGLSNLRVRLRIPGVNLNLDLGSLLGLGGGNGSNPPSWGNVQSGVGAPKWNLVSNLKWSVLEDITQARLSDSNLRDAFITFMASECGDKLGEWVDQGNFVAAQNAKGSFLPDTVFLRGARTGTDYGAFRPEDYDPIINALERQTVRVPPSFEALLREKKVANVGWNQQTDIRSFREFFRPDARQWLDDNVNRGVTNCAVYFQVVLDGFRFEAAHIFYQLINSYRPNVRPEELIYSLFYGWDIKTCSANSAAGCNSSTRLTRLSMDSQFQFMNDMVLMYLFKNEMFLAPKVLFNPRYSSSDKQKSYAETQMRTVGEKTKFGELYSWAALVPKVQAMLLYFLAIAYPFACVLVVVPGWHKTVFTWMSFWAWVKLWDAGFALVAQVERTVWASIGNNSSAKAIADKIVDLQMIDNFMGISCPNGSLCPGETYCSVPKICDIGCEASSAVTATAGGVGGPTGVVATSLAVLMRLFDQGLVLSSNLDLDLANAYYIFIMAALYLAVPAVTGQLVLGAKAGVSGLVSTAIGGVSSEAGRAAGGGFSSAIGQNAHSASNAIGQAAKFKGMAGYAESALAHGNKALQYGMIGNAASGAREAWGQKIDAANNGYGLQRAKLGLASARVDYGAEGRGLVTSGAGVVSQAARDGQSFADNGSKNAKGTPSKAHSGLGVVTTAANGAQGVGDLDNSAAVRGASWEIAKQNYATEKANLATVAGFNVARADVSLAAFQGQGMEMGEKLASSRLTSQAEYAGDMQAWQTKNEYANAMSGDLAAMGVSPGFLDPGPKPTQLEGAALAGALGEGAQREAMYALNEGGYLSDFHKVEGNLQGILSGAALSEDLKHYGQLADVDLNGSGILFPQLGGQLSHLDMGNGSTENLTTSVWDEVGGQAGQASGHPIGVQARPGHSAYPTEAFFDEKKRLLDIK